MKAPEDVLTIEATTGVSTLTIELNESDALGYILSAHANGMRVKIINRVPGTPLTWWERVRGVTR